MFEQASRLKLRFNHKGLCSVEDLWDLPVTTLNKIFQGLNATLKQQQEESLLDTQNEYDKLISLSIDIIRHIVKVKIREQKERDEKTLHHARKQQLLGIIAEKQNQELYGKSIEDLQKLIGEL
ncbi:MAG: hypothetical protein ACE5RJ_01675 [Nitrosopumilaceae archaeon]